MQSLYCGRHEGGEVGVGAELSRRPPCGCGVGWGISRSILYTRNTRFVCISYVYIFLQGNRGGEARIAEPRIAKPSIVELRMQSLGLQSVELESLDCKAEPRLQSLGI